MAWSIPTTVPTIESTTSGGIVEGIYSFFSSIPKKLTELSNSSPSTPPPLFQSELIQQTISIVNVELETTTELQKYNFSASAQKEIKQIKDQLQTYFTQYENEKLMSQANLT